MPADRALLTRLPNRKHRNPAARRSGLVAALSLVAGLTALASMAAVGHGATAASNPEQAIARAAAQGDTEALASDMLRDYRRGGPDTITKLTKGCCGVRAINVYYLAKPGRYAKYGAYALVAVFADGRLSPSTITSIALIEYPTYRRYQAGSTARTPTYSLALARNSQADWSANLGFIGHSDLSYTTGQVALHEEATFLTPADLSLFYAQALHVLRKAESHAPVTPEEYLHPGLPCDLMDEPVCASG